MANQTYTKQEWETTKKHWNYVCAYCYGNRANKKVLTKEHVIPESKGGTKIRHNIIPACAKCNSSKSSYNMEDWFREQPFFDEDRLMKIFVWIAGGCYTIKIGKQKQPRRKP